MGHIKLLIKSKLMVKSTSVTRPQAMRLAKLRRRRASTAAHAQGHHYYVGTRLTSAMFQQLVLKHQM